MRGPEEAGGMSEIVKTKKKKTYLLQLPSSLVAQGRPLHPVGHLPLDLVDPLHLLQNFVEQKNHIVDQHVDEVEEEGGRPVAGGLDGLLVF
jgi:hypothetical protein